MKAGRILILIGIGILGYAYYYTPYGQEIFYLIASFLIAIGAILHFFVER